MRKRECGMRNKGGVAFYDALALQTPLYLTQHHLRAKIPHAAFQPAQRLNKNAGLLIRAQAKS